MLGCKKKIRVTLDVKLRGYNIDRGSLNITTLPPRGTSVVMNEANIISRGFETTPEKNPVYFYTVTLNTEHHDWCRNNSVIDYALQ